VFGRRAALAACREPAAELAPVDLGPAPPSLPSDQTRAALWRQAGLRRDADGLRALLEEPLPLARSIALACLAREESRGAHQRSDRPALDPALDGLHTLVTGAENTRFERWE
jgi:L-aspartate oxidase